MSLVAYGSSDESSDEEVISDESNKQFPKVTEVKQIKSAEVTQINKETVVEQISDKVPQAPEVTETQTSTDIEESSSLSTNGSRTRINLPTPKTVQEKNTVDENESTTDVSNNETINFNLLPQPKSKEVVNTVIEDDDDYVLPPKSFLEKIEKLDKKEKGPVKISVPSLSDFKDLDEEKETKQRLKPSQKGTGLFAVLPPPRSETLLKANPMVPRIISKKLEQPKPVPKQVNDIRKTKPNKNLQKSMISSNYDSNSDDEDTTSSKMDFFSLSTKDDVQIPTISISEIVNETLEQKRADEPEIADKTLVSNVMNLPKEEIIQKNKAEVGPKLPVPEQEYNVDSTGNLVFDEKAIEYLCGKRGVKRKNTEFKDVDIIDINGEDMKPDERDWMVKALTEEPVTRPMSQGGGPSGLSKKKHQITYLAHQAKAMEVELKNQWAQNKLTKQQTQSKYGF